MTGSPLSPESVGAESVGTRTRPNWHQMKYEKDLHLLIQPTIA